MHRCQRRERRRVTRNLQPHTTLCKSVTLSVSLLLPVPLPLTHTRSNCAASTAWSEYGSVGVQVHAEIVREVVAQGPVRPQNSTREGCPGLGQRRS